MSLIGIRVPRETCRLLSELTIPGKLEDSSRLHVTVLDLGKNINISTIAKVTEVSYKIISKIKPFHIFLERVSFFPRDVDIPIIIPIISKELQSLNAELKEEFKINGLFYSNGYEYKPHITLSYSNDKVEYEIEEPLEMVVQEIVLFGGDVGDDKIFVTFPLKAPKIKDQPILSVSTSNVHGPSPVNMDNLDK